MQTLGHFGGRTSTVPVLSLLERAGWLEKLPLTLVCGGLLGLASPPYGIWWLAWLMPAALIVLIQGARSKTDALLTGLLFGLAYHLVSMRWLLSLHPLDWFGITGNLSLIVAGQIWVIESLHQALLTALFALFVMALPMRNGFLPHFERPRFPFLLSVPLIWVFLQWVVAPAPFFLGVPIDQLAYSQARMPQFIQIARFGGAPAVDFVLILLACTLATLIIDLLPVARRLPSRADVLSDRLGAFFDFILVAAIVVGIASWGQAQIKLDAAMPSYFQWPLDKNHQPLSMEEAKAAGLKGQSEFAPAIPVAVVQAGMAIERAQGATGKQIAGRYLPLMRNLGTALVVLPAGVAGGAKRGQEPLLLELPRIAREELKDIIAGVRLNGSGSGYAEAVRIFAASNKPQPDYIKYRQVPFVEYTPLGPLGSLVPESVQKRLQGGGAHLRSQQLMIPSTASGKVGASLSSEIVYPDLIVSQVNRGASLLVNLNDLSHFHGQALSESLLAAAVFRAVENGRYVVVASDTGISAIIDPRGVVTSASIAGRRGVIVDRIQFLHDHTPYSRLMLWTPLYK